MYILAENLKEFEKAYGHPEEFYTAFEMNSREFKNLLGSQKDGRSHDVTIFIRKDGKWIVNSKHWYPEGLYRFPSGGIRPDETIEEGALREAYEETGCRIELKKYFMRIHVRFYNENKSVDWISHLVLADYISGKLEPVDTKEIKAVYLAERAEFEGFARIMLKLDVGGLHYREYLQREAFIILDNLSN